MAFTPPPQNAKQAILEGLDIPQKPPKEALVKVNAQIPQSTQDALFRIAEHLDTPYSRVLRRLLAEGVARELERLDLN